MKVNAQAVLTECLNDQLTLRFLNNDKLLQDDPAALWNKLRSHFVLNTTSVISHVEAQYNNIAMSGQESIDEFTNRFLTLIQHLDMLNREPHMSSLKGKFTHGVEQHPNKKYKDFVFLTRNASIYP